MNIHVVNQTDQRSNLTKSSDGFGSTALCPQLKQKNKEILDTLNLANLYNAQLQEPGSKRSFGIPRKT